jgi:hypothetical protein
MKPILDYSCWSALFEQTKSTFTPALPVATANEIVQFLKTKQWSTGGWIPSKSNETIFYKVADSHNKNGQVHSSAAQYLNQDMYALGVTECKLFLMDKPETSWINSQLVFGKMYAIYSKGEGEQGTTIDKFTPIGSEDKLVEGNQYDQTQKYAFAYHFVSDPSSIQFAVNLYNLFGEKAKYHFKKQVSAIASGISDASYKWLNDYKSNASTLLSKLS